MKNKVIFLSLFSFLFFLFFIFPKETHALSWDIVMNDGFGEGVQNRTINSLVVFGDYIYAGVNNTTDGAKVLRSTDGSSWTQVNTNGFGDSAHTNVVLFTGNNILYAGTVGEAGVSGFKLLKTTNGTDWVQIGTDGFGTADNYGIQSMTLFGGKLYISVYFIDFITFDRGVRVYRIDSDSSWTKVNEEGFGDTSNVNSYAMSVFEDQLYVGTHHIAQGPEIWRTSSGTNWNQVVDNGFGEVNGIFFTSIFSFHEKIYASMMSNTGIELWRSDSGNSDTWVQMGEDGFGSANNLWTAYTPVIVNDVIYFGTGNETANLAKIFISQDGENWAEEDNSAFLHVNDQGIYSGTFLNGRIYFAIGNDTIGSRIIRSETLDLLEITTESSDLPEAIKGENYSYQLEYENGTSPYTCTWEGDLPEGMEVTSGCKIEGTPQKASNHTFTVYLSDSGIPAQIDGKELTLIVNESESEGQELTELPETGVSFNYPFVFILGLFLFFGLYLEKSSQL